LDCGEYPQETTSHLKTVIHGDSKNEVVIKYVVKQLLQGVGNKPTSMADSSNKQ